MTVRGLKSIDLASDTVEILGVHFSYNKENQNEKKLLQSNLKHSKQSQIMENTKSNY